MLLKWTARAFAAGAALHVGVAAAQDDLLLIPPGPAGTAELEAEPDPAFGGRAKPREGDGADRRDESLGIVGDAGERLPEGREQQFRDARKDTIRREARFAPGADPADLPQVDGRIRAATEGLAIDDETRSRYRWHNGEWWFKTRAGQWKFYRDGDWQEFDPTTYEMSSRGDVAYGRRSAETYPAPRTYSSSGGYYNDGRPYSGPRPYTHRSDAGRYDGRIYGGSRLYDGRYDGRYYDPGQDNPGYGTRHGAGYRGYDPGTDRYYGSGPYGRPYSIDGDRYRGGVIGSEIGGRIGGRAGAILGGAIGAEAAD